MARKTYEEKLNDSRGMPKLVELDDPKAIKQYGGKTMLIAPPLLYDAVMKRVPYGRLITADAIRAYLAKEHGADFTCPLTAGIFMNIVAGAAAERKTDDTPYWRTLRKDGELNEKYPGGIDAQKLHLEIEGHTVIQKGKRRFVKDYQEKMFTLE